MAQGARSQGMYAREGGCSGAVGDVRGRECGANWTRRDARRVGGRGGMANELCAVREEAIRNREQAPASSPRVRFRFRFGFSIPSLRRSLSRRPCSSSSAAPPRLPSLACCHSHKLCRCCVSMGCPHTRSCACALASALDACRCMSDTEKLTVRVDGRARPARMRIGRQAFSPVAAFVRVPVSSNLLLLVHGACF